MEPWVIELLDALCVPDAHSSDITVELRRRAEEFAPWPDKPVSDGDLASMPQQARVLESLAAAFAYHYREPEHREGSREPYVAEQWLGRTEHLWPPRVRSVGDDTLAVWGEAAALTERPLAAARLHDLLFLVGHGDARAHIVGAVEAYMAQAEQSEEELNQARALGRALEIAVAAKQEGLRDAVTDRLVASSYASLEGDDHKPGVTLRFVSPLIAAGVAADQVTDLLARTRDRYADDQWITETVVELQRSLTDDDTGAALAQEAVELWLRKADQAEGLSRHVFLDRAAELAGRWGVNDLKAEAIRRMQAMTVEELGMHVIEESITLSDDERDKIERWVADVVGDDGPVEALRRLVVGLPPSGHVDRNRQQADEHRQEFVFTALLTPKRLGYGAMPLYEPTTEEERADVDLAGIESLALQAYGPVYAEALSRIGTRYAPDTDQFARQLADATRLPPGAALSVARAMAHYWSQEHEAAAHIALPRVETAARALLTELGEALFVPQAGPQAGRYPTLGSLLSKLRGHGLDESWYRYLRTLLAAPGIGWNVRNDRLHGLEDDDVPRTITALILIATAHLALLPTRPPKPH